MLAIVLSSNQMIDIPTPPNNDAILSIPGEGAGDFGRDCKGDPKLREAAR